MSNWNNLPSELQSKIIGLVTTMYQKDHKEKFTQVLLELKPTVVHKWDCKLKKLLHTVFDGDDPTKSARQLVDAANCLEKYPDWILDIWHLKVIDGFVQYPTDDQLAIYWARYVHKIINM